MLKGNSNSEERNKDDCQLLIVITPEPSSTAIADYGQRWGIET